jgi:hypothetical protein
VVFSCLGEKLVDFFYLWKPPPISKGRTAEQPLATPSYDTWSYGGYYGGCNGDGDDNNFPGGGINNHQSTQQWTDASIPAEASTSLAPAKPKRIENNTQPEVSELFTPLKIVLYTDGLGCSQALRLPQARGAATTAIGTTRKRIGVEHRSVKR